MANVTFPSYVNINTAAWAGDFFEPENLIPGGGQLDAPLFLSPDAVVATVGAGGAAAGAVAVPVTALSGPLPNGTTLFFGGSKFARLTAAAAAGATSLTVSALPTALVAGDTATYSGIAKRSVPSGIVVGRTYAERDAGALFGPAADADDEVYLIAFDVTDVLKNTDVTFVRPGTFVVKENLLPNVATMSAAVKTKIRGLYVCVYGKPT